MALPCNKAIRAFLHDEVRFLIIDRMTEICCRSRTLEGSRDKYLFIFILDYRSIQYPYILYGITFVSGEAVPRGIIKGKTRSKVEQHETAPVARRRPVPLLWYRYWYVLM